MFYAFNDIECLYNDLECFMLSLNVSKACPYIYIWLSSSNGRGRSIGDQLLDLAFMINHSQSTFMLLAHCQYLHRSNIVRVGHRTIPSSEIK